jgi:hypothetical protein
MNIMSLRFLALGAFCSCLMGLSAAAQPMNNSDNSPYPSSNQLGGAPNEPDRTLGNSVQTYRQPDKITNETTPAPVNGTGAPAQEQVLFDNRDATPSPEPMRDISGSNNTVIYTPATGGGGAAAARR